MDGQIIPTAEKYRDDMTKFMRDLIGIPSESGGEKEVVRRIRREMEDADFDEIRIDKAGSIAGRIGEGKHLIVMDARLDAPRVVCAETQSCDPYKGRLENGYIYGCGSANRKGGIAASVYAGKIVKELELGDECSLWITGTVQNEESVGTGWDALLECGVLPRLPDAAVVTEPTNLALCRAERGWAEIVIRTKGTPALASDPDAGGNAVYAAAKIICELESLNARLPNDETTGKATLAVTKIETFSRSARDVPDRTDFYVERRLTPDESKDGILEEIKEAVERAGLNAGTDAEIQILTYSAPSYTGYELKSGQFRPAWVLKENSPVFKTALSAYGDVIGEKPEIKTRFGATNGLSTMGTHGVPTIVFGPAEETHACDVSGCPVDHLIKASAFYAAFVKDFPLFAKK